MALALALGLAGCSSAPHHEDVLANGTGRSPPGAGLFQLDVGSLGPITPATRANVEAIESVLGSRYTVKTVNNAGSEIHVFLHDELLFYVIPNDDGSLFNVHVVSPKVAIVEHPEWVIGSAFQNPEPLTSCECWGSHPVCFRAGDHVAVAFEIACGSVDTATEREKVLPGVRIQRAVWNPRPFGGPSPPSQVQELSPLGKLLEPLRN